MKYKHLIAICALTLIPQSALAQSWKTVGDLPHYSSVTETLYRGAQPSPQGLQELKDRGIVTVISLRHNRGQTAAEAAEAAKLGLKFYSLPLNGIVNPSSAVIRRFLGIVNDPKACPVFVHCEEGVDRTGTMVALYRIDTQNWSADKAYKEMLDQGFHKKDYPWMAETIYDWEAAKSGTPKAHPLSQRLIGSLQRLRSLLRMLT